MKEKISGILSVTIEDQTFNLADFENVNSTSFTFTLDIETSKKYYEEQKEKLLKNSNIKFINLQ